MQIRVARALRAQEKWRENDFEFDSDLSVFQSGSRF